MAQSNKKSYRCPKFDGDAKQTLDIPVERKRNNYLTNWKTYLIFRKVWKFSNYKREQRLEFYKSKNFTNLRILQI